MRRLSYMAIYNSSIPDDCQTVAYAELVGLNEKIKKLLNSNVTLDSYSRGHLTETSSRITKVVEARLEMLSP